MKQIRTEFGLDLPPEFEDQYRARLMAAFAAGLQIMPHVRPVLEAIDMPFCIATSSSPMRAASSLGMVGLSHLTGSRLFTATMVERGKPAPDLFLLCAEKHHAAPERCLVIEDSLNGIRAERPPACRSGASSAAATCPNPCPSSPKTPAPTGVLTHSRGSLPSIPDCGAAHEPQ